MGARKQAKGSVGRWQRGHAPRRVPRRQGEPVTKRASPPLGTIVARRTSDQEGTPPAGHRQRSPSQCRAPSSPRGCKGRSPLHKKTKNLPLPAGKGGGGMGRESKLKAASAGGKEGMPPHRVPRRQGEPATKRASPHTFTSARCQLRPTAGHSPTPQSPRTPPADDPLSASFRCRARRHAENRWRHRR